MSEMSSVENIKDLHGSKNNIINIDNNVESSHGSNFLNECDNLSDQNSLNVKDTLQVGIQKETAINEKTHQCNVITSGSVIISNIPDSSAEKDIGSLDHLDKLARPHFQSKLFQTKFHYCPKCMSVFKNRTHLERHLKMEHNFKCYVCNLTFSNKELYLDHGNISHSSDVKFSRYVIFFNEREFSEYIDKINCGSENAKPQDSEDDAYKCKICHQTFNRASKLRSHMTFHKKINHQKSKENKKISSNKKSLSDQTHNISNSCEICKMIFSSHRALKKHLLSHKKCKFACDECGKLYRTHIGLTTHLASHNSEGNKLTCTVCAKTCNSLAYLRLHVRMKHPLNPGPYECNECGKQFKVYQSLKNHIAVTHDDDIAKLYICKFCDKRFISKQCWDEHEWKHFSYRRYLCETCGMRFRYKTAWKNHIEVVHSNKKDFLCPTCGKLFKTKFYLDSHTSEVHDSGKPIPCSYCEKLFKTLRIMKRHVKTCHTSEQERKYICAFCDWKFYSPKDLCRHEKIHTKLKEFSCTDCGKKFNRKDNLQVHIRGHKKKLLLKIK